jgi:voltage-gated sodium channel
MEQFAYAWIFFVLFILVATFTMLNLFIAIIVNAMQSYSEEERTAVTKVSDQARDHIEAEMHVEFREMREEMRSLREEIGGLRRDAADTRAKAAMT